jgi:RNA polymerase sigma-70 factor (ECF subfamily)
LHDAAEAEDAAQDAFVRAYQQLYRFDTTQPLRPWLLRLTRNVALNRQRSLTRYWQMTRRYFQMTTPLKAGDSAPTLAAQAEGQLLWEAVQQLRPKSRDVIYLRYFLELSEAETAVALTIPIGTVKSRLSRALKTLRGIIEREYPTLKGSFDE